MAKNKWVVFFTFALLTQEVFAIGATGRGNRSSAESPGSSGTLSSVSVGTSQVVSPNPVSSKVCDEASEQSYIPYSLLKALSRDGSDISISKDQSGNYSVNPYGILKNGCFTVEFQVSTLQNGSVGLLVKANKVNATGDDVSSFSKILSCLEKEGKYDPKTEMIIHSEKSSYDDYGSNPFSVKPLENKDITTRLVYLSPTKSFNDSKTSISVKDSVVSPQCFYGEKLSSDGSYVLNRGVEFRLQEIAEACKAKEIRKIVQMRAGNSVDVQNTISQVLDALILEQADVKKDNSLISEINKSGKSLASFSGTRDDLIDAADDYLKLVDKWHSEVTEPALMRIAELSAQLKSESDKGKIKELKRKIADLKKAIGTLDEQLTTNYRSIRDKLRDEGLGSRGMEFYEAKVKSLYFSKVGEKFKDKDITISSASEIIASEMKKEEPNFKDWDDTYAVKHGDKAPLEEAMRQRSEITSDLKKKYKDYQQREQSLYKQNCTGFFGPANPVRCRYLMENKAMRDKSFISRVYPSQQSLIRLEGNIGSWYNMYQQWGIQNEIAESELAIFGNDPSFNFTHEGQFRQQQQGFDAYNPAYYQMMQQQGMQQGGQQQNYMPMMVN